MSAPQSTGYLQGPLSPKPGGGQGGDHAVAKKRVLNPGAVAFYIPGGSLDSAQANYARISNPSGRLIVGVSVGFEATDGESLATGTSTWQARAGRLQGENKKLSWLNDVFVNAAGVSTPRTLPDSWSFEDSTEELLLTFNIDPADFGGVRGALVLVVSFEATPDMSPAEADSLLGQVKAIVGSKKLEMNSCEEFIIADTITPEVVDDGSSTPIELPFPEEVTLQSAVVTVMDVVVPGVWVPSLPGTSDSFVFTPDDPWDDSLGPTGVVTYLEGEGECAFDRAADFTVQDPT